MHSRDQRIEGMMVKLAERDSAVRSQGPRDERGSRGEKRARGEASGGERKPQEGPAGESGDDRGVHGPEQGSVVGSAPGSEETAVSGSGQQDAGRGNIEHSKPQKPESKTRTTQDEGDEERVQRSDVDGNDPTK